MNGAVVVTARDDSRAIGPVLAEVAEAAASLARSGIELRVILADAGSTDQTVTIAEGAAAQLGLPFEAVRLASCPSDTAVVAGLERALAEHADFVVSLDGDGQHDARQIPDLVRAFVARQSGMTIGSRWTRGGSSPGTGVARSVLSRAANIVTKVATGVRGVSDTTTSFRVYRPEVAELVCHATEGIRGHGFFSATVALTQAHGYSVDEVPITFRPRYSHLAPVEGADVAAFARNLATVRARVRQARRERRANQARWVSRSGKFRDQAGGQHEQFAAIDELMNLSDADNFTSWTAEQIEPYLGQVVVEVGAGLGAIARKLAAADPDRKVLALEPAGNLYPELVENLREYPNARAMQCLSGELLANEGPGSYDSIVYISVLEHIEDDVSELQIAKQLVRPGGAVCLFVPAMPSLYGTLDYKSGHYRRYSRDHLAAVIDQAGLEVEKLYYLELAGVLPYWLMYRVLQRGKLDSTSSGLFDKVIVPASRLAQRIVSEPGFGKNLLAVARRPQDPSPAAGRG